MSEISLSLRKKLHNQSHGVDDAAFVTGERLEGQDQHNNA